MSKHHQMTLLSGIALTLVILSQNTLAGEAKDPSTMTMKEKMAHFEALHKKAMPQAHAGPKAAPAPAAQPVSTPQKMGRTIENMMKQQEAEKNALAEKHEAEVKLLAAEEAKRKEAEAAAAAPIEETIKIDERTELSFEHKNGKEIIEIRINESGDKGKEAEAKPEIHLHHKLEEPTVHTLTTKEEHLHHKLDEPTVHTETMAHMKLEEAKPTPLEIVTETTETRKPVIHEETETIDVQMLPRKPVIHEETETTTIPMPTRTPASAKATEHMTQQEMEEMLAHRLNNPSQSRGHS